MNETNRYKAMMSDIHAPAELLGKVKKMPVEKAWRGQCIAMRYTAAALAGVIGVFGATNGICYAATGETWVEKATVLINGNPVEMDVVTSKDGDVTTKELTYELADGSGALDLSLISEGGEDIDDSSLEITDYTSADVSSPKTYASVPVQERGGRIYMVPDDAGPIDITDQLKEQGGAIGEYQVDGVTYVYKAGGESGSYYATVERK